VKLEKFLKVAEFINTFLKKSLPLALVAVAQLRLAEY
jgi:hypothetical protein